ncbi:hypothetical protein FRC03_001996 [Tulasnella sp. 419]|nr:hypothetical protein FRC03_001996 [Tulasnella sp. 419]
MLFGLSFPSRPIHHRHPHRKQISFHLEPRHLESTQRLLPRLKTPSNLGIRQGISDFADVEAVLQNFEKQTANVQDREAVEAQRQYLGGDEKHTVLVKGLDFALLEQTKARLESNPEMDDALEEAFVSSAGHTKAEKAKKRTREDIVRELKEKRGEKSIASAQSTPADPSVVEDSLIRAKQMGKFRPIGAPADETKGKSKEGGEKRKKKKRKLAAETPSTNVAAEQSLNTSEKRTATSFEEAQVTKSAEIVASIGPGNDSTPAQVPVLPPPEPDEDLDIFADVGEYEGLHLSDDDDEGEEVEKKRKIPVAPDAITKKPGNWFGDASEPEVTPEPPAPPGVPSSSTQREAEEPPSEENQSARLAPLVSSTLPSIRDMLEMDKALEIAEKKKARKEKMKKKNQE